MPHTDLLTSPQVGAMLHRSPRTVHRLVGTGDLTPAMQLAGPNGAYLFHRADVEAYLKQAAA